PRTTTPHQIFVSSYLRPPYPVPLPAIPRRPLQFLAAPSLPHAVFAIPVGDWLARPSEISSPVPIPIPSLYWTAAAAAAEWPPHPSPHPAYSGGISDAGEGSKEK
ncbi:unnamed protein product, partial [Urochloa humidicola]